MMVGCITNCTRVGSCDNYVVLEFEVRVEDSVVKLYFSIVAVSDSLPVQRRICHPSLLSLIHLNCAETFGGRLGDFKVGSR